MPPPWSVDDEVAELKIACARLDSVLEKNVERLRSLGILGAQVRLHESRVLSLVRRHAGP